MNEPRDYARSAASLLRGRPLEPRSSAGVRDRGISSVAYAMVERRRARTLRRALGASAALALSAAALALFLGMPELEDASGKQVPAIASAGLSYVGVSGNRSFAPGSRISAGPEPLSVRFGPITRVDLERESELAYESEDRTRRFRLLRGTIRLRVEKLRAGERFIVETPDAEVEVRGTSFEVTLAQDAEGCDSRTRVRSFEGSVEVRFGGGQQVLAAGQDWPPPCQEAQVVPTATVRPGSPPAAGKARLPRAGREAIAAVASAEPVPTGSELALQNDLYAAAVAAKRRGSTEEAAGLFEQLIMRYPGGPLEESASVERMRVLATSNPGRAAAEARRYLSRFPRGFARREAESVLGKP